MKCLRLMFVVLVLNAGHLQADETDCQSSNNSTSKSAAMSGGCFCPLFPVGPNYWYVEYNPPASNCNNPQVTFLEGSYTTSYCVPPDCLGGNCLSESAKKSKSPVTPLLQEPVAQDYFPVPCEDESKLNFPKEHAKNCTFADPRFITFELPGGRVVTAKLFAVVVDVQRRTGRLGNPQRGKQLAFLGFECKTPSVTPKTVEVKSSDERHAIIKLGIYEGGVILAEASKKE